MSEKLFQKIHFGCFIALVLLGITDAVFVLVNRASFTSTDELAILIMIGVLVAIYLFAMFLPNIAFFLFCLILSIFTRRGLSDLTHDDDMLNNFMRGRFIYLLFAIAMLVLIFFETLSFLLA